MASIQKFEDLEAWKIARELTRSIYSLTRSDRFSRDFGLRDQICRSSVSIMSNVAEDQDYISESEFQTVSAKAIENSRVISGLSSYLRQSDLKGRKFK